MPKIRVVLIRKAYGIRQRSGPRQPATKSRRLNRRFGGGSTRNEEVVLSAGSSIMALHSGLLLGYVSQWILQAYTVQKRFGHSRLHS